MATPDEIKILKIIDEEGGEASIGKIARKMQIDGSYCRIIINSMGSADIVDVYRTGQVAIADKGWASLGKKSETLAGGDAIKRYMNDMKKWKAF